jgi:hypothetical protein
MSAEGSGIVEILETLKTVATLLGILMPLGTMLYFTGAVVQRIKNLETLLTRHMAQETECKENREAVEDKLHDRCTRLNGRISYLEGRQNGHTR